MRRATRLLPTVAAAALVVAGCGGGDEPSAPPEPTGPAPVTEAPADPPASPEQVADPAVPESLEFTGTTVAGEPFDAAELVGEPAVLWFWAPWCPKCRGAAPDVRGIAEQVAVVGIGGLDEDSAMQGFVDSTGTDSFTHLSDPDGAVWQKFGVTVQHTYVLIAADGEVAFTGSLSGSELRDRVAEL